MNVLFLSEQYYPFGSGAEVATSLYAELLGQRGFNVKVVTNSFSETRKVVKEKNVTVYYLPLFASNQSPKYSMLKRTDVLFSKLLAELIDWANVVYVPRFWFLAIPFVKMHKKPVVVHLHDYIPICPLTNVYRQKETKRCSRLSCLSCVYSFERKGQLTRTLASIISNLTLGNTFHRLIGLSDAIVCVSSAQKNIITKELPHLLPKTCVIYNPFVEDQIPVEGNDLGYFGGLDELKGLATLLTAANSIRHTSDMPITIQTTKISKSVKERVSFEKAGFVLNGLLNKQNYDTLYRKVRAVIVPSLWPEPWPYVVAEALLGGRYVIASEIGGIPEQVSGCKGVKLLEAGSSAELKEALEIQASLDTETMLEFGYNNTSVFRQHFSNQASLDHFSKLLENVKNNC